MTLTYKDRKKIWVGEDFPCRIPVKQIIKLTPETAIPVKELRQNLSYFLDSRSPNAWSCHFRRSPLREKVEDAKLVIEALHEAVSNPIVREIDPKKLLYTPKTYSSEDTEVTIPEKEDEKIADGPTDTNDLFSHEEIEWLLLELGQNLGLDLWLAKNDRNRVFKGHRLGEFKKIKEQLPVQFSPAVNRTIELIDVLWLDGDGMLPLG